MKRQTMMRRYLALLGCIPLLTCLPYILNAWKVSPLDSKDYLFAGAFIVSAAFALLFTQKDKPQFQLRSLIGTLIFLTGHLLCRWISFNAGGIICAIIFWWLLIWFTHDDRLALNLLPSFLILLLSVVSSTYWLCVFLGLTVTAVFWLKIAIMCALLCVQALMLWKGWMPRLEPVLFCLGMAAATIMMLQIGGMARQYPPLLLEPRIIADEFLGREMNPDESFKRFFQKSDAHHYQYAGPGTENISLLSVKCGANIHEIHPASHCLRTSGWLIDQEHQITIEMRGKTFCVTEVKGHLGQAEMLLWVWYSNDWKSTANFISFRRWWTVKENWNTYQLGILGGGSIDDRRGHLMSILEKLAL